MKYELPSHLWISRYLGLIRDHVSLWSKDPSTKVGALLISPDRRVVLPGYNGFPPSLSDSRATLMDRPSRLARTIHAEENCIRTASKTGLMTHYPSGWTLISSHHPCSRCATLICDSGVGGVIYEPKPEFESRWAEDLVHSRSVLEESGVVLYSATMTPEEGLLTLLVSGRSSDVARSPRD